ncbi:hypothetical protein NG798_12630 [Ancylothrix sp. C2]|uniref:hypothetical protein n=1 Tax=Ancylothrix sp. D3o TaxID=2953691 RepID=UPI0021BA84F4|nr:hypothetical protein [Ancylothrix sp. D3o]MCT7950639.1 hypothetical protein [Ancylothrix sp. D3o]
MNSSSLSQNGKVKNGKDSSWLKLSVEAFFGECNWAGQPVELQQMQPGDPLPFTVTVREFFGALPWEGTPMVAMATKPLRAVSVKTAETQKQSTLADLMDLF